MKVSSIFLLITLFTIIESDLVGFNPMYCTDYFNKQTEENQAFSRGFCKSLGIDAATYQCCYLKYKSGDRTYYNCAPLTLSQFYDIDSTKDSFEQSYDWDVKSLECTSSSYLYGSFLLLLFILF